MNRLILSKNGPCLLRELAAVGSNLCPVKHQQCVVQKRNAMFDKVVKASEDSWKTRLNKDGHYISQNPDDIVYDGWATFHLPFSVKSRFKVFVGFVVFTASAFWLPWIMVHYHLRKANRGM